MTAILKVVENRIVVQAATAAAIAAILLPQVAQAEAAQAQAEAARDLAQEHAANAAAASGLNQPYESIATAEATTIAASVKGIVTRFRDPTYPDTATLVGGANYVRASLADITASGVSSLAYFRSTDRYMPDGSTDSTNGGYWLLNERVLTPEMLGGGVGDAAADTAALLALRLFGDGFTAELNGNYTINSRAQFVGLSNFRVFGTGTVTIADGVATGEAYSAMLVQDCEDFIIEGLTIDGNRAGRTPAEASGHLIRVIGGKRGIFRKLYVKNATTDGIYVRGITPATLSTYPEDMLFDNCVVENSYRNAISIVGAVRPTIRGGSYRGSNGTAPEAGVAVEPNTTDVHGVIDLKVEWPDCSDNEGYGSYATGVSTNDKINGHFWVTGRNNGIGLFESGTSDGLDVRLRCGPHSGALTSTQAMLYLGSLVKNMTIEFEGNDIACTGSSHVMRFENGGLGIVVRKARIETTSIPFISTSAVGTVLENIVGTDITGSAVQLNAARCVARKVDIRRVSSSGFGIRIAADNVTVDGFHLEDCAVTSASLFVASGSGVVLANGRVHQTVSVPSGANAYRFDTAPASISNLSATGGYTRSNMITASAGLLVNTAISGLNPNPLAATFTWQPGAGTLAAGATSTTTGNVTHSSLTDTVNVTMPAGQPAGLVVTGHVSTNGTVTLTAVNPTSASISPISGAFSVRVVKS